MICGEIPLENVYLCHANSVENMAVLTDILIIPAGCWTSVHHARRRQSISHSHSKRGCFWNYRGDY